MGLTRRQILAGAAAAATGVFSFGGYAFGYEPLERLKIQRHSLRPRRWPDDLGLSVAALSDIHASDPFMTPARIRTIVDRTNALEPDVIVLLGDYVFGHSYEFSTVAKKDWAAEFGRLKAPLGVYAILGNHDWWEPPTSPTRGVEAIRRAFAGVDIPVLENQALRLVKNGRPFWLLGLGDQLALGNDNGWNWQGIDDLPGTLAQIDDDAPAILLAHEPDIFVDVPDRVSLTLSGHTHGGQVRIFGWSPIVPSRFGNRYAYGHVVEGERHLIVTGGLGLGAIPVRFGVPPEILFVELGGSSPTS